MGDFYRLNPSFMMKAQTFQDLGETCPWLKPSLALPTEPVLSLYGHTTNARRRQSDFVCIII
jgi:hypothetical protein